MDNILLVYLVLAFIMFYFLLRNQWVCKNRRKLIASDYENYSSYLSYDEMLYRRFWVWDIRKLRKDWWSM